MSSTTSLTLGWLLSAASLGVCLAQNLPAPGEGAARVITLSGTVSVMHDSTPWALHEGDSVQPRQMIVTGPDGYALFKVSDGSTFEVFPNSRATFRDNANWRDLLDMWLGRVKVHIQKWGGQPNPNRVHTPTAVISVRGTTFDVEVEDEDATMVLVEEGQVDVQHRLLPRGDPKVLNPGEWLRVYKDQPLAQKSIDKGGLMKAVFRAVSDAIYTAVYNSGRSGSSGGSGGGLPGDHGGTKPTPPPPPPPPSDSTAPPE